MKLTRRAKQMLFSIYEGRNYKAVLHHGGYINRGSSMGGAISRLYQSLEAGGYIVKAPGMSNGLTEAGNAVAKEFQWKFYAKEPFHEQVRLTYSGHPVHNMTAQARLHPDRPEVLLIQIDKTPFEINGERWDNGWHEIPRWWARKRLADDA